MRTIVSDTRRRGKHRSGNVYKRFIMTRNIIQMDELIHSIFFSHSFKRISEVAYVNVAVSACIVFTV